MKLLEKLKNTFFEEEYVEVDEPIKEEKVAKKVDVKEIKKEKKLKPVEEIEEQEETPVKEEIKTEEVKDEVKEIYSDRDLVNRSSKIATFDDSDFEPTRQIPVVIEEEPKKLYGESYVDIQKSINLDGIDKYNHNSHRAYGATEKTFQPTPIISPIYGILDKNYRKEEVVDKKDKPSSYVSKKNVDLDSVRRKAYGENSLLDIASDESKESINSDDAFLYDMTNEAKPIVGEVTVGDAEEYFDDLGLEYNIDYKDEKYENATGRRSKIHHDLDDNDNSIDEVIINSNTYEDDEDVTLDDLINRNKENDDIENANLEDNLFDLVDSMYEGGE